MPRVFMFFFIVLSFAGFFTLASKASNYHLVYQTYYAMGEFSKKGDCVSVARYAILSGITPDSTLFPAFLASLDDCFATRRDILLKNRREGKK